VFPADVTAGLKAEAGRLIQANPSGHWKVVSDLGHQDYLWSGQNQFLVPDQFPDANPYGVLAGPGVEWVADAASNTIDRVTRNGTIVSRTFIPSPPVSDAVPTCIDKGPDGALYIGQLTGVGNAAGAASIWRLDPTTGTLTQWATGLTAITGCGFGADGNFYAVEFSNTGGFETAGPGDGVVVRVSPHSTTPTVIASGLSFPNGFAAGADGSLYISNWSVAPASTGLASVLKITLG
jgi:sugar lactone lactonase YvrE